MAGTPGAVLSGRDRLVVLFGVVVLGILGAAVLVSSDGRTEGPGASTSPVKTALVEGIVGRATSINPLMPQNAADLDLIALVFSGLTRSFPDGSLGADLAERWTISPDGKVYTFTLRGGATWHDGRPVTADDVVFTILTIQAPDYEGPLRASWRSVRVEKLDTRTVRFTLAEPLGAFLQATTLPIVPAHRLVGVPVASLRDAVFNREPVGSGPYRLVRLDFDEAELELVRSSVPSDVADDPRGGADGDPGDAVGRIIVRFYPDGASLAGAYRTGVVDTAAGLLPEQGFDLETLPGTTVLRYPSTILTAVVPNMRPGHPLFANADVRRGLLRALDREAIVTDLFEGAAERADSPISPRSWAYDQDSTKVYDYDQTAAAGDFKKAGWTRGSLGWSSKSGEAVAFGLATIDNASDPLGNALAQRIIADWTAVRLTVTAVEYGADGFVAQLVRGNFDVALLHVNMGLDPDVFPLLTSSQAVEGGSNVGGYQSGALDRLLKAARLGTDREARAAAFAALQEALTAEVPILPIAFVDELYVVRDGVVGPGSRLVADRSGRFWDVLTWRLADGRAAASP